MLTDDDKARLRAEELYREELRRSFIAPRSRSARLAGYLSAPLGLWFLSTVVVGTGGWAYTEMRAAMQAEQERVETIHRLDSEITYRLRGFRNLRREIGPVRAVELLERPDNTELPQYLFVENEKRPLSALLWELHEVVDPKERPPLAQAYATSLKFSAVRTLRLSDTDKSGPGVSGKARRFMMERLLDAGLTAQFNRDFNLPRWGKQFEGKAEPDPLWGGLISPEAIQDKLDRAPQSAAGNTKR